MPAWIENFFAGTAWWHFMVRSGLYFLLAWVIYRVGRRLSPRIMRLSRFAPRRTKPSPERQETLQNLIASAIGVLAFLAALLFSLQQFIATETLVWMVGLFSAAFGLGARPQISDFLSGAGFLFEDTFAVGEKVEILGVEGVIEAVSLRTTWMRAPTGELYVIPNGEIRMVRNFSRGRFSTVTIKLKINTTVLNQALGALEELGEEAVVLLTNLIEPWQVISETGTVGEHTELTLVAHARFGKGAEMRPRLLALVHERLEKSGVVLVD